MKELEEENKSNLFSVPFRNITDINKKYSKLFQKELTKYFLKDNIRNLITNSLIGCFSSIVIQDICVLTIMMEGMFNFIMKTVDMSSFENRVFNELLDKQKFKKSMPLEEKKVYGGITDGIFFFVKYVISKIKSSLIGSKGASHVVLFLRNFNYKYCSLMMMTFLL